MAPGSIEILAEMDTTFKIIINLVPNSKFCRAVELLLPITFDVKTEIAGAVAIAN